MGIFLLGKSRSIVHSNRIVTYYRRSACIGSSSLILLQLLLASTVVPRCRLVTTTVVAAFSTAGQIAAFSQHRATTTAAFLGSVSTVFGRSCSTIASVTTTNRHMTTTTASDTETTASSKTMTTDGTCSNNPLLGDWSKEPYHFPPFALIQPSHFPEALEEGMRLHMQDLSQIVESSVSSPTEATFENTIAPYDRSGKLLDRVGSVFSNLCSSVNTDEMKQVQTQMVPLLSRHRSACFQYPGLFERIQHVYDTRNDESQKLTPEQVRLVERIHLDFTRKGAALSADNQKQLADIEAELATLTTQFQQNVMKDEETYELVLKVEDMKGCPEFLLEAARSAAIERKKNEDEYVITLSRSLVEPFLTFCDNRALRKQAWEAWIQRGEMHPDRDNVKIATQILKLRQQIAHIHGYKTYAQYQCIDRMAQTPENVMKLLEDVWERSKIATKREYDSMIQYVKDHDLEGMEDGVIEAWDWRYVAEKVRKDMYDFDGALLKPYLSLDNVREALFGVSSKLFGLKYVPRPDLKTYHPDVETYEVRENLPENEDGKNDRLVSLFLHDNYARPYKGSGAWMSEFRSQTRNLDTTDDPIEGIPIVVNNNNFAKGSDQTLLSYDDAVTMFHEFGHAHHGMLSDATYGRLASTNVLVDFVELPSQLMENWFTSDPAVLKQYAKHYQTGEPIPDELIAKLKAAENFQQGFQSIEYTICALLDMLVHQVENYDDDSFNLQEFEKKELERLGMPQGIVMRHRPAHFSHLFATSMYAAGYYVYLWAEVLDKDAFGAFEETGDIFDPETAAKARKYIYGAGNTEAPDVLFRKFRGRDPQNEYMLRKKGLL